MAQTAEEEGPRHRRSALRRVRKTVLNIVGLREGAVAELASTINVEDICVTGRFGEHLLEIWDIDHDYLATFADFFIVPEGAIFIVFLPLTDAEEDRCSAVRACELICAF